jgi:phage terminase small subunit
VVKTSKETAVENPLFLAVRQSAADVLKFSAEFGMTPAARVRLNNPFGPPPGPGKFDGLLGA